MSEPNVEPVLPPHPGPTTLLDVAREAGVSLATASRVLNGSARKVAEPFRAKVEAAADLLGYTANLSAQATARGTSALVALLVADIADPYFAQIASAVVRGADRANVTVTIAMTSRDEAREAALIKHLRAQRPRGLILAASRTVRPAADAVQAELDAFVGMGGKLATIGRGSAVGATVAIDNEGGAHALASALAGRGYRSAIIIAAEPGVVSSDDRTGGFTRGLEAAGGRVRSVLHGSYDRESGRRLMSAAIARGIDPHTLVFAASDVIALGVMSAIRDAGRRIGEDIAVCGFDDIQAASDIHPSLTTVKVPLDELGTRALHTVLDDDERDADDVLALEVILRDSTPPLVRSPE